MTLRTFPMNLAEANRLVRAWHRHNGELRSGCFFAIGAEDTAEAPLSGEQRGLHGGRIVGAVIVGSVAARLLYQPWGAEVRRLVTDGTPNACSFLYGAAWRAAQALGYEGLITFTLTSEPGKSLRASNWRLDEWNVPVRTWRSRAPEYAALRWSERPVTSNSPALPRLRWFIGRRLPSQSSIAYADDPLASQDLRRERGVVEITEGKALALIRVEERAPPAPETPA